MTDTTKIPDAPTTKPKDDGAPGPMLYDQMPMTDREHEIFHSGAAAMLSVFASRVRGIPTEDLSQLGGFLAHAVPMPAKDAGQRITPFIRECMERVAHSVRQSVEADGGITVAKPGDVERAAADSKIVKLFGAGKAPKVLKH